MAADCGLELKKHNVAFVSLWPGPVKTEHMLNAAENLAEKNPEKLAGPDAPVSGLTPSPSLRIYRLSQHWFSWGDNLPCYPLVQCEYLYNTECILYTSSSLRLVLKQSRSVEYLCLYFVLYIFKHSYDASQNLW